ncbi:hypothetical protein Hanom_Chr06g00489081 [Helianthus anomalus]
MRLLHKQPPHQLTKICATLVSTSQKKLTGLELIRKCLLVDNRLKGGTVSGYFCSCDCCQPMVNS